LKPQKVKWTTNKEGKRVVEIGNVHEEGLIKISNSKIKTFTRCEKTYDYKYNQNLQKKRKKKPLWKGDITHSCLEAIYSGQEWKPVVRAFKRVFDKLFEEEKLEYGNLPQEIYNLILGYQRTYKGDPKWEVLHVEFEFLWRIPGTPFVFTGRIDLIVKDSRGFIWVVEHKTTKRVPDINAKITDFQSCLYLLVGRAMGYKVRGVVFNYLRTKAPTVPRLLQRGGLSRAKDVDTDYYTYLKAIKDNELDPEDYRDILGRLKSEPNRFYVRHFLPKSNAMLKALFNEMIITATRIKEFQNPVRSFLFLCDTQCDYYPLCLAELQGHDVQYIIENEYERRDNEDEENQDQENEGQGYH
jgi:hypothetical protein